MSSQRIEKILEKYFQGETSLTEERTLREFFLGDEVPQHMAELKNQFLLYEKEREIKLSDDFEDALFEEISKHEKTTRASKRSMFMYIGGVAATILILITLFIKFDPFVGYQETTENNDANMAFAEASRILYYVSDKFNQGTGTLGKVALFDEEVNNLKTVNKFDAGMSKASPISRFDQITKLITNPAP
jgi:hypothetical protein